MYAVVSTGGKQYRVAKDDVIVVEKLKAQVGDTIAFDVLLVADGDDVAVGADAATAVVTGEVVEHLRGQKVTVFKFKKRKGYKRTRGHRQDLTRVRVADVSLASAKPKAAPKKAAVAEIPAEKPKRARAAKPKAEAKAEEPASAKAPGRAASTKASTTAAAAKPSAAKTGTKATSTKSTATGAARAKTSRAKSDSKPEPTETTKATPPEDKPKRSRAKKTETEESAE